MKGGGPVSDNPIEKMVRDFQDRIVRGTYDGIYRLEGPALGGVMECQASECVTAFTELYGISDALDLDAFLEKMQLGGSSKISVERSGILWTEHHEGRCLCPLVTRGVIPLDPKLCGCAEHWLRKLFERRVVGPVRVELLDSAAKGGESCVFRVTIDDPSPPARA
jgi:hypothetical protein